MFMKEINAASKLHILVLEKSQTVHLLMLFSTIKEQQLKQVSFPDLHLLTSSKPNRVASNTLEDTQKAPLPLAQITSTVINVEEQ